MLLSKIKPSYHHIMLALFLLLQIGFWNHSHKIIPSMEIVDTPYSTELLNSISFGDKEFIFRLMGLRMNNAGDTFGRSTALYKYDLNKVKGWFLALDSLNNTSNLLPSLAAYYYSQTQNKPDVRYMVDYMHEHSKGRSEKWWWTAQAAYLAMHKLEDSELALKIAEPLKDLDDIPFWARQTAAFVYEKRGEFDAALAIMENVIANADKIPAGELNFMRYFVEERIDKLNESSANTVKILDRKNDKKE